MDGFAGFKTAAVEENPEATAVMDPFHVVRLAGDALERCRRRVQQDVHGHRGRQADSRYKSQRALLTGADLLTEKQYSRLQDVFERDDHVEVEATWAYYQHMVATYREPDKAKGKAMMQALITEAGPSRSEEAHQAGRGGADGDEAVVGTSWPTFGLPRRLQRPHRGHQRPIRAPSRLRPGIPESHQLHRPISVGIRRIQAPVTPWIAMSHRPHESRPVSVTSCPLAASRPGQFYAETLITIPQMPGRLFLNGLPEL